ncbi:hypothetical protein [Actinomadura napierensis]|uniref:hypothetical protein n=1 Tax=Actinomadura napierensis TaxID=267854 RepID=UPI0031DAC8CE
MLDEADGSGHVIRRAGAVNAVQQVTQERLVIGRNRDPLPEDPFRSAEFAQLDRAGGGRAREGDGTAFSVGGQGLRARCPVSVIVGAQPARRNHRQRTFNDDEPPGVALIEQGLAFANRLLELLFGEGLGSARRGEPLAGGGCGGLWDGWDLVGGWFRVLIARRDLYRGVRGWSSGGRPRDPYVVFVG